MDQSVKGGGRGQTPWLYPKYVFIIKRAKDAESSETDKYETNYDIFGRVSVKKIFPIFS